MEREQILKGNSLIAAFMGGEYQKKPKFHDPENFIETYIFEGPQGDWRQYTGSTKHEYWIHNLCYHLAWDWIMPVYDKVKKLFNDLSKEDRPHYEAACMFIRKALLAANIEALWLAIVGFINVHNMKNDGK